MALRCSDYEDVLARLERRGLEYRLNEVAAVSLRQIFVLDPNGVRIELNVQNGNGAA